jgi:1-acyl-sn-glycerol-3-phosphate acyltransferase
MSRAILSFLFYKVFGWRIISHLPPDLDRFICVVAPHTSNWDFPIGLFTRRLANMGDTKFLAKKSLFKPPFGWLFRALGGYPVDRSGHKNQVDAVVAMFERGEIHKITITPEGTRKYQPNWKTGFHHIARKANVPIILGSFDYATKTVHLSEPFPLTDDANADVERMKDWFRPYKGRHPELGIR